MFQWLAGLVTGPIINGVIDGYKAKLAAGNDRDRIAADLAGRELQVQQREIEVAGQLRIAQVGRWYEPEHLFGYTLWLYFAKCIVWDKVLGDLTGGSTDALTGAIDTWAGLIIVTYFGKRGFENVARILRK
jgi:hypothetical protein